MGLDMYLTKRTYVKNWDRQKPADRHVITITHGDGSPCTVQASRIKEVVEEVMYWRKANHIHRWFVENVQGGEDDCRTSTVSRSQLEQLARLCHQVLAKPERAPVILPTGEGFFFGGTEYDKWYFSECKRTAEALEALLLESGAWHGYFQYHAAW